MIILLCLCYNYIFRLTLAYRRIPGTVDVNRGVILNKGQVLCIVLTGSVVTAWVLGSDRGARMIAG